MKNKDEVLRTCRDRLSAGNAFYSRSMEIQESDYRFYHGSGDNGWQWSYELNRKKGDNRPRLTINLVRKDINRILNEWISNLPAIRVLPLDDESAYATALALEGMIRTIGGRSNNDSVMSDVITQQATKGVSYFRIETDYVDDQSFDQEIKYSSISDSFSVVMDPDSVDVTGKDARWCFVLDRVHHDKFDALYGKEKRMKGSLIDSPLPYMEKDRNVDMWTTDSTVLVADYYFVEEKKERRYQWSDGAVTGTTRRFDNEENMQYNDSEARDFSSPDASTWAPGGDEPGDFSPEPEPNEMGSGAPALLQAASADQEVPPPSTPLGQMSGSGNFFDQNEQPYIVNSRTVLKKTVRFIKTNGTDILEEGVWAGDTIPVIRVTGSSYSIDGITYYTTLLSYAKDAQRMYNYLQSKEAELMAKQPIASWIAYDKSIEPYRDIWEHPESNPTVLPISASAVDNNGQLLPLPQRSQPPAMSQGLIAAEGTAEKNIRSTIGVSDAFVGEQGAEQGKASVNESISSSNYVVSGFQNNLKLAVEELGRQIVALIPIIYDTPRGITAMGEDGKKSTFQNSPGSGMSPGHVDSTEVNVESINGMSVDLSMGKYYVDVVSGPDYQHRRIAALADLRMQAQTNQQLWADVGDLLFEEMDWPGAKKFVNRIRKNMDPKLLDGTPAQVSAIQQLQQQIQELQQQNQQLQVALESSPKVLAQKTREMGEKTREYNAVTTRIKTILPSIDPNSLREIVKDLIMEIADSNMVTGPNQVQANIQNFSNGQDSQGMMGQQDQVTDNSMNQQG